MSGLFGFSGPADPELSNRIGQALAHRGRRIQAQDQGDRATTVFLSDHPPDTLDRLGSGLFIHPHHDLSIALSGQVLAPLPDEGPILEHLLERYLEEGVTLFAQLRGAFVLVIRDGAALHLVRDGVGARTLYWGQHAGRTFFSVEAKGLLAVPGYPRRLRPAALAQYLSFSFVPGAGTMLEDVQELLPGHHLTLREDQAPELRRWFHFEDPPEAEEMSDQDWVERFAALHADAVRERIPDSEPVATFLSGGLDSSIVVAELRSQGVPSPRTFSIHFGPDYPNELPFARAVAERCGADHSEVLIEPRSFLPRLRSAVWSMDEPIGDPITIPNFELARQVGREFRWVFNGEGGDPVFGGPKNFTMLLHHWYEAGDRAPGFRERRYLESYRRAYTELDHLLTPDLRGSVNKREDLEGILTPFFETDRPVSFLHKLLAINIRLKGAHLILPKVERMLGAWGVTPLSPLFDERLVRLAFAMPGRMKLRHGIEKVVLKQAYAGRLPAEVIERPKSGMRVPVHFWFQGELRKTARHLLSKRKVKQAGLFEPDRVQQLLNYSIKQGPGRYGLRLWMLVTFEIWRRLVIEGEAL
ncbi:MAG: asparagine synthase-related protein [Myxococcota bacterium]|nr:asparagine synthase-related protein [Myxococcota bacterium]